MQKAYVRPGKIQSKTIYIPGSKSYTNRALIIASLAEGKSVLINPLFSKDTEYTIQALKMLGIKIEKNNDENLEVNGEGGKFEEPGQALFLGNAGTGIRFVTALLTLTPFKAKITGNERMKQRPIKDLITALRNLGAKIESSHKNGCPPVKVKGSGLKGGKIELSGKISSQYLSALLMIAPYAKEDIVIEIVDELASKPYIDMTIQIMNDFGVNVDNKDYKKFSIKSGQRYKNREYVIEGDASSASYFFALSALHEPLTVANISRSTKQADIGFLEVLEKMGCEIEGNKEGIIVHGTKELKPLGEIDLNHMPDAAMTVAVMCAFAKGKSSLKNIPNLRVKETNRIEALVNELSKLGINIKELSDGLEIDGNPEKLHGDAVLATYRDHRMAMCAAILASKIENIKILDPKCTSKTFPTFFDELKKIGLDVEIKNIPNIVLTGMRGSGKSSIGRQIAKKLHMKFIDTDDEIEKQEKMKIPQIIKKNSWFYFRKKEKYVVRKIGKMKNAVISTGGGVIIDKENEKSLKKNGRIIFLKADLNALESRLSKSKTKRPPLTKNKSLKEELEIIWNKRKEKYLGSADLVFDVSKDIGVEKKAEQIIMEL